MADNIDSKNINEYIKSHSQKIKRLENNSSTKTLDKLPTNSQGDNGDIYIVKDKNRSYLVFKSNNVWNEVSSDLLIRGTQNTGGSNNQSDSVDGYDYDSGWIDASDSNDSNTLGTIVNPKGIYRITHNMGATLLSGEVFCRFEALNNGQIQTYTINLNSSSSYPGPNANRYGYWIEVVDTNNVDLHVYPDGLGILYSDRFKDENNNTSVLLSSDDTQNIASLEVRVFLKKIVNKKGKKPSLHYSNSNKNPFSGKRKNGKVLGKSVVGDKGASVDGTKNSSFKIDSDGTGVLLKNESGVLKVRDLDDSNEATLKARRVQLTSTESGTTGIAKGEIRYDTSGETFTYSGQGLLVNGSVNGSSGDACSIISLGFDADSVYRCMDSSNSRWVFGNDYSDSHKFKIQNASSLADSGEFALDVSGNLVVSGTLTSSNGVCGGPAVTNYITNNAADVMTVSDFGANAALKIDADQPATAGAEDSIGLHIDYDRAVATSGTAAHNDIGIDLDVNSASLGTSSVKGMDIDVVGATSGTHTAIGIDLDVDGSDTNIGLNINTAGTHIKMEANADTNDYATFAVADTGDLTIATTGDGTTDSALILDIDGSITLNADSGIVDIKNDASAVYRGDTSGPVPTHYFYNSANNADYLKFTVSANGLTTFSTVDNDGTRGNIVFSPNGKFVVNADMGGVYIDEISAAGDDVAGDGQLWVKDSTPNELCFTDDAGTDIVGVGKYMYDIQRIGYYATATASYIPMTGYVIESTSLSSGNERLAFIAPYNGTIHQVQWRSEIAQDGTTSFRILESSDGTEVPGTLTGRVDETVDIADDTTHTVDFSSMTSGDVNLDKGKVYALYISHPSAPNDTNVTVVFKWDITT